MTEYEIEDLAGTMINGKPLYIISIGPTKRLEWRWEINGEIRSYSEMIQDADSLTASQFRGILDSVIDSIKAIYPDETFTRKSSPPQH
ncbi:hypothetical protein [Pantoea ananatis]|uniref:hypothetical protein n=1 Tax=Pantoea ananas TaxID=553 RepID=UPI0024B6778E|nr:hypothetical protein [Pantoea ananatis]MDJ0030328.1 hypothetical protein [Pantoea ananatis]